MKKIYTNIYSAIAILVILGTVFGFIYGLIQDADKGNDEAKRNFNFFAKSVIILADKETFADTLYTQKLNRLAEDLDLKAFVLSSGEKQTYLSWFKEPDLISYTQEAGFSVKTISPFIKYFNADIAVKVPNNPSLAVKVSAALSTVKPDAIYTRSRTVFFASLTVFLLTFIIILLQKISAAGEKIYANIPVGNNDFSDYIYGETVEETKPSFSRTTQNRTFNTDFKPSSLKTEKEYTLADLNNLNLNKKFPYETDSGALEPEPKDIPYISEVSEKNEVKPETVSGVRPQSAQNGSGLYSPITGIAHKEHFQECLEMELKRAASSEQDLALIIIRLKEFSLESLVAKKIAELLIGLIKFKDRIFEFGDDGFAVILQDTNLDTAMKISEEIYKGIKKIMDEYHIFEPIAVGITTRTSRLLSPDRFIEEAVAAAGRAMASPDEPIVAFKVDTERYRRFISETL